MIELLPDTHEMLTQRMDIFDFEAPNHDPYLVSEMLIGAMNQHGGVGIAANQIGLNCRAMAIMVEEGFSLVMFNPMITELSPNTVMISEGCLTFPGLFLRIARPVSCRVNYHDCEGIRRSELLTGIPSRIALHEVDHLNGVVMTSKVSKLKLDMARKRMRKHH